MNNQACLLRFAALLKEKMTKKKIYANTRFHVPALLAETINGLNITAAFMLMHLWWRSRKEIILRLNKHGKLLAFDQDEAALKMPLRMRLIPIHSNFKYLKNFLNYYGLRRLTVSYRLRRLFHHFDEAKRGFHFGLMVFGYAYEQKIALESCNILNVYGGTIGRCVYFYGELRNARRLHRLL